jgi:hypothetical protein
MLEKLKEFVVRLVKDEEFRTELENQPSEQAQTKVLEELGYNFALPDVEAGAIKILELAEQGLFKDIDEGELTAVFGGLTTVGSVGPKDIVHASYGVSVPPSEDRLPYHPSPSPSPHWWWPYVRPNPSPRPGPQPIYGAPITPKDLM